MDIDQLQKRLEWLEDERRKDKLALASLEERLANQESVTSALPQQYKELDSSVTRLSAMLSRIDQIETNLLQVRVESSRNLESSEKTRIEHDREVEKAYRADLEGINKAIAEVRRNLEPISELKKGLQTRTEEDYRLGRLIEEIEQKILTYQRSDDEFRRSMRIMDEANKQENKRLVDLQAEVVALRKRLDEQRGKVDVTSENLRKVELRLSEFQAVETERRQTQAAFVEKMNLWQFEKDRAWKDIQTKFDESVNLSTNLEVQIQSLDATQRAVKRSQEAFDEITTRFDRRINEISEMQRLVEDRFRQEWVSYKADVQKRWTNYSLAQEEQQREFNRLNEKFTERLVALEDITQELRDRLHLVVGETSKQLQGIANLAHQWIDEYERALGRSS